MRARNSAVCRLHTIISTNSLPKHPCAAIRTMSPSMSVRCARVALSIFWFSDTRSTVLSTMGIRTYKHREGKEKHLGLLVSLLKHALLGHLPL